MRPFLIALLGCAAFPIAARAQDTTPPPVVGIDATKCSNVLMKKVTYLGPMTVPAPNHQCDLDAQDDPTCTIELRGWLYMPIESFVGNRPAVIYEHGHDVERNEPCAIAEYFTRRGYVVFAPLRRGHRPKLLDFYDGMRSTGMHVDDYMNQCPTCPTGTCAICATSGGCTKLTGPGACKGCLPSPFKDSCTQAIADFKEVSYMVEETVDVQAAIDHLKTERAFGGGAVDLFAPLVDPARITLLGHSFGGSLIVFANARVTGHIAAISVSGAELSWPDPDNDPRGNPWYPTYYAFLAPLHHEPLFVLQPANGKSVLGTQFLANLLIPLRKQVLFGLFPEVSYDCSKSSSACKQVHGGFVGGDDNDTPQHEGVESWGPFAHAYMKLAAEYVGPVDSPSCTTACN